VFDCGSEAMLLDVTVFLEKLGSTMRLASDVLLSLTEANLRTTLRIQGYTVSGLDED
jgi:hypothetical protein